MKYLLKKYWIHLVFAVIINIPLLLFCTIRTNYSLTLKGDTVPFTSVVEVDTDYVEEGSFSTIYVISMDKSTVFQNWVADIDPTIEKAKMSASTTHISYAENNKAAKIMYKSSVSKAIVLAYKEAKKINNDINIEYELDGFEITYYSKESQFRIGDKIIAKKAFAEDGTMYTVDTSNEELLRAAMSKNYIGEEITVIRDGVETVITLKETDSFGAYDIYDINYDTIFPKVTINETNVGGPSGGLLQTLSIYNRLIEEDITHGYKIAGTGTISYKGNVGAIGGIREKVPTALDDNIDIFFCVAANYDDALEAYNSLPDRERMKLVRIETFYDALEYLKEGYKNDFRE